MVRGIAGAIHQSIADSFGLLCAIEIEIDLTLNGANGSYFTRSLIYILYQRKHLPLSKT